MFKFEEEKTAIVASYFAKKLYENGGFYPANSMFYIWQKNWPDDLKLRDYMLECDGSNKVYYVEQDGKIEDCQDYTEWFRGIVNKVKGMMEMCSGMSRERTWQVFSILRKQSHEETRKKEWIPREIFHDFEEQGITLYRGNKFTELSGFRVVKRDVDGVKTVLGGNRYDLTAKEALKLARESIGA